MSGLCSALASVRLTARREAWEPGLLLVASEVQLCWIVLFVEFRNVFLLPGRRSPEKSLWQNLLEARDIEKVKRYWYSAEEQPAGPSSANAGLEI